MHFLTNRSALAFGEQLFPRVFSTYTKLNLASNISEPHNILHVVSALIYITKCLSMCPFQQEVN